VRRDMRRISLRFDERFRRSGRVKDMYLRPKEADSSSC
jgi:hypothetical protein